MKTNTKKLIALGAIFCLFIYTVQAQNVGINTSGATPSQNAILDLNTGNSGNLGVIIPHVSLSSTLSTFGMAHAASGDDVGMMVYNTNASAGSGIGYYYWNGGTWVSVSGGVATVYANNGLSIGTGTYAGYVELGGPVGSPATLMQNSVIGTNSFNLDFDLGTYTSTGSGAFLVTNGGAGNPLLSVSSSGAGINVNSAVSTLDDNGSFGNGTIAVSGATTLTNAYSTVIATPPGVATAYTLSLPSATANPRRIYTIVYNGNGLGTININSPTAGSIMLGGAAITLSLSSGAVTLQSDGSNWDITSTNASSTNNGPYFQTGSIAWIANGTYSWTVPAGITQVEVFLIGAGGGCAANNYDGASGGYTTGILAVTPGEVLYVVVGKGGLGATPATTGLGGGGGGSYIQYANSSGALLCGAGGGGGAPGTNYYETIGGTNYVSAGYGGGSWFSNSIANLKGSSGVATVGAGNGPGGASYTGYLTNAQAWRGEGEGNNPTSGKTNGTAYSTGYGPGIFTATYGATTNGAALATSATPTNTNPNAGLGAITANTAGTDGEVVLIW